MKLSVLLICVIVSCSVLTVHGECPALVEGSGDENMQVEGQLPGVCWVCEWALNKIKKSVPPNSSAQVLKDKILSTCKGCGLRKYLCKSFVNHHMSALIEELSTTDGVKSICVKLKACK